AAEGVALARPLLGLDDRGRLVLFAVRAADAIAGSVHGRVSSESGVAILGPGREGEGLSGMTREPAAVARRRRMEALVRAGPRRAPPWIRPCTSSLAEVRA